MKVPIISKGLAVLGGIGGPTVFFGTSNLTLWGGHLDREIEIVSSFEGTNWKDGVVTPVFDSWWLSGGFKNPVSYSYSYIARANGTNYSESSRLTRRTKRDAQEGEGELRLVERVGSLKSSAEPSKSRWKSSPHHHLDGLTTKKFFLMGVNKTNNEVEMTGLVSLVKTKHNGIKQNCNQKEEKDNAIQKGFCDNAFFKTYFPGDKRPGFIETQLKNKEDNRVGVLRINLPSDGKISVTFGGGKLNSDPTRWSRSAPIKVAYSSKNENLYVGKPKSNNRPYVVVHDLKFAKGVLKGKWKEADDGSRSLIELGMSSSTNGGSQNYALATSGSTIQLSRERQYYLWDPSYTHIKDGALKTKNGHKLPWNVNFSLPFTVNLVK